MDCRIGLPQAENNLCRPYVHASCHTGNKGDEPFIHSLENCFFQVFFYLLLRGASRERDWAREDQEQLEYLREYNRRKAQRKTKRQQSC